MKTGTKIAVGLALCFVVGVAMLVITRPPGPSRLPSESQQPMEDTMPQMTNEEIAAWVDQIVRDQPKPLDALYEAIKGKPVSFLIRVVGEHVGEQAVKSMLNYVLEERKGIPQKAR